MKISRSNSVGFEGTNPLRYSLTIKGTMSRGACQKPFRKIYESDARQLRDIPENHVDWLSHHLHTGESVTTDLRGRLGRRKTLKSTSRPSLQLWRNGVVCYAHPDLYS